MFQWVSLSVPAPQLRVIAGRNDPLAINGDLKMNIKIVSLALVAALGSVSAAAASESYFTFGNTISAKSTVDFDLVRAEGAGTVAIYDYTGGVKGVLLGMADVNSGANTDLKIAVPPNAAQQLLAEIIVDGQTVASKQYFVAG
jgi:hypothetical protein